MSEPKTQEQYADEGLQYLLERMTSDGTSAEKLLASWLLKTRAVNHRLMKELEALRQARQ